MPLTTELTDKGTRRDGYYETVIAARSSTVFIDGLPAARQGDLLTPHTKPKYSPRPRKIARGSSAVLIDGLPAARTGDVIDCGGVVIGGGTVNIGWCAWEVFTSLRGLRFTLEVDGQEPDAFAAVSFRLTQNQSYPFMTSVDIASDSFMQTAKILLEKNAALTIWQGVIPLCYVTGAVAEFGMQENNGWQMCYHLRIEPPLWRYGLRQNFRIFQQQDIRTISATLLNENGVTEWTPLFYEGHPTREFYVQYGESDPAFLARLWAERGIFFFKRFATDNPERKLTLCDDMAGLSQAGELPFNPDISAGAETECVSMFRYEARVHPSSMQSQDYTFKVPDWPGMYE